MFHPIVIVVSYQLLSAPTAQSQISVFDWLRGVHGVAQEVGANAVSYRCFET